MKIEIANLEFLFSLLENISKRDIDPTEVWKADDSEASPKMEIGGVKFDPCELPEPLECAGLLVHRVGDLYSSEYIVASRDRSIFRKLSERFGQSVADMGKEWYATSNDGTGYILSNSTNRMVIVSIMEKGERVRSVGLGTNGASPRRLSSQDLFIEEMEMLGQIGNGFINCCYESIKAKHDLTLYLTI